MTGSDHSRSTQEAQRLLPRPLSPTHHQLDLMILHLVMTLAALAAGTSVNIKAAAKNENNNFINYYSPFFNGALGETRTPNQTVMSRQL